MSLALVGEQAHEIHRRVGRNLLLFQGLEVSLKLALPYLAIDGNERTPSEIRALNDEMRRWTLGQLLAEFSRSIKVSDGFWVLEPEQVTAARNDLVHHFFSTTEIDHTANDAFDQAARYLDQQFEQIQEINAIVSTLGMQVLADLLRNKADRSSEETAMLEKLERFALPGLERVDETQSPPVGWENTRIVRLLRRAETETEPIDGYTLLSRAGVLLRREDPLAHPKMYGYSRLSEVIDACQLFDVVRRPPGTESESGGGDVLYRSRR